MNILISIISGAVQGLTEFLPISSSGHLVLLHFFFGIKEPQVLYDLFLHLGTSTAVIIYFRREIIEAFTKKRQILWLVILGTTPLVLLAFLFKFCPAAENALKQMFVSPLLAGFMFLITGIWLCLPNMKRWQTPAEKDISVRQAVIVGLAQVAAIFPGISRSGATISTGLISKMKPESAARFSFLLSIPAILGGLVFELKDISGMEGLNFQTVIPGFLSALIVGYIAIHILLKIVYAGRLYFFGFYCFLLGLIVIITRIFC